MVKQSRRRKKQLIGELLGVHQIELVGFIKQSSKYKEKFILAVREGENTAEEAELHAERFNRRR